MGLNDLSVLDELELEFYPCDECDEYFDLQEIAANNGYCKKCVSMFLCEPRIMQIYNYLLNLADEKLDIFSAVLKSKRREKLSSISTDTNWSEVAF